jgi:hypothetical protein
MIIIIFIIVIIISDLDVPFIKIHRMPPRYVQRETYLGVRFRLHFDVHFWIIYLLFLSLLGMAK